MTAGVCTDKRDSITKPSLRFAALDNHAFVAPPTLGVSEQFDCYQTNTKRWHQISGRLATSEHARFIGKQVKNSLKIND